jgi:hypothetical protein
MSTTVPPETTSKTVLTSDVMTNVASSLLLIWVLIYFVARLKLETVDVAWTIATMIAMVCTSIFLMVSINVDF